MIRSPEIVEGLVARHREHCIKQKPAVEEIDDLEGEQKKEENDLIENGFYDNYLTLPKQYSFPVISN